MGPAIGLQMLCSIEYMTTKYFSVFRAFGLFQSLLLLPSVQWSGMYTHSLYHVSWVLSISSVTETAKEYIFKKFSNL